MPFWMVVATATALSIYASYVGLRWSGKLNYISFSVVFTLAMSAGLGVIIWRTSDTRGEVLRGVIYATPGVVIPLLLLHRAMRSDA